MRVAREEKGLTLEDVAAQTRIPRRHLESLENSDWERLPAPTYTTGFAKSYATAVGLVLYGQRHQVVDTARSTGMGAFGKVAGRLKGLFREFF